MRQALWSLKTINRETPAALAIHLIADNHAIHKHPKVKVWLAKHPSFHMHFTPTSSSWLNLVERFFRDLTDFITEKSFASLANSLMPSLAFWPSATPTSGATCGRPRGEDILRKIAAAEAKLAAGQVG